MIFTPAKAQGQLCQEIYMIVVQFFLGEKKLNYDDLYASKSTRPTLLLESAIPQL
jgi:hypothetical protein